MKAMIMASHTITLRSQRVDGVVVREDDRYRYVVCCGADLKASGMRSSLDDAEREVKGWMSAALIMGGEPCVCCRKA